MKYLVAVLLMSFCLSANADDNGIGRYQISGEWRLDTKTGEVLKLADVYASQMKLAAGEIQLTLAPGERVVAIGGYSVHPLWPVQPLQHRDATSPTEHRIRLIEAESLRLKAEVMRLQMRTLR